MSDIDNLKTEIALLKKDAKTGELIHQRLEIAIDKLSEIVISCKQMLAQQEQKLAKAEQTDDERVGVLEKWRWLIIGGSIIIGLMMSNPDSVLFNMF